jgi:manganese/zinc/iron transport system permease protein
MFEVLFGWVSDYTLRTVALGSATLGVVSGVLGSFALLRRQSLLGDALSHAALPGIAAAFLLTHSKAPLVLILGAGIAAWLGALLINGVVSTTRIKTDAAMGVVLSVFFGAGVVLLTYIQRLPDAGKAGLDKFLFGQAAALLGRDVVAMALLSAAVLLMVGLTWKELKLLTFDPGFAASLGFPVRALEAMLTTLLVVAIVIGLQAVGVVLMSALVVAPAAAARQWTDRFGVMVLISAVVGAFAGVAGALLSSTVERLPTGPTIVLMAITIVMISMLFAPHRGLLVRTVQERRNRRRLRSDVLLMDLYVLSLQHEGDHPHTSEAITAMRPEVTDVRPSLEALEERRLVARKDDGWVITDPGREVAQRLVAREESPEAELAEVLSEGEA